MEVPWFVHSRLHIYSLHGVSWRSDINHDLCAKIKLVFKSEVLKNDFGRFRYFGAWWGRTQEKFARYQSPVKPQWKGLFFFQFTILVEENGTKISSSETSRSYSKRGLGPDRTKVVTMAALLKFEGLAMFLLLIFSRLSSGFSAFRSWKCPNLENKTRLSKLTIFSTKKCLSKVMHIFTHPGGG